MNSSGAPYWKSLNQEGIVLVIAAILFVAASIGLPGFLAADNLVSIVRSVSVLGILALGMAIVIIGRGIDLSAVAIMAMSVAWYLQMLQNGVSGGEALALTLAGVVAIGLINGFMVVKLRLSAFIVTLAMLIILRGMLVGATHGRTLFDLPAAFYGLMVITFLGLPLAVWLAALAFVIAGVMLRYHRLGRALYAIGAFVLHYTAFGRGIYAVGANPEAARLTGIKVNRLLIAVYTIAGAVVSLWQLPADQARVREDNDRNTYVVVVLNGDLEPVRRALIDRGVDVGEVRRSANNEFVWFYDPDGNRFELSRPL